MRIVIITILVIAVIVGAIALYLWATTPTKSAQLGYPLNASQRALVAAVPADADSFAVIPTAAALDAKLRANPMTRSIIEDFRSKQPMPPGWIIGNADLAAWHSGDHTAYAIRLDTVRAMFVRLYLTVAGDVPGRWNGTTFIINSEGGPPIDNIQPILDLARGLPPADALVVQRAEARGAYPPIGRPVVTAVNVTPDLVTMTSHAAIDPTAPPPAPLTAKFPPSAMLSASFNSPPRAVGDLNRLFGAKVSPLLERGGSLVVYDIDARKLLPRPIGVIALPDDPQRREAFDSFTHTLSIGEDLGIHSRTAEENGELLLAFDDQSIDRYRRDAKQTEQWPAARWALRMNPQLAAPKLEELRDDTGLRIAAPHIFRSARDLGRWIEALKEANSIDAVDVAGPGGMDELRVRISSK